MSRGQTQKACPSCGGAGASVVLDEPVAALSNSRQTAPLVLKACPDCGLVFQSSAFDPGYDEMMRRVYQGYLKSGNFEFPRRSAENLRSLEMAAGALEHGPTAPRVLEIGSNRGDLLYMLKEKAPHASVLGVEPSQQGGLLVPTVRAFFDPGLFSSKFDLVIMQHVLEHIKHPARFMAQVGEVLEDDGLAYVEVPDLHNCLENRVEDFCLEHVNYFSPRGLANAMRGFELEAQERSSFLRTIWCKGKKRPVKPDDIEKLKGLFSEYAAEKRRLLDAVRGHRRDGGGVVFYGAGYYFQMLFRALGFDPNDPRGLFFMDDSFAGEQEPAFGLPRKGDPEPDDLVLICSNNFTVQEKMAENLRALHSGPVLRPWLGIDRNTA